jgi:hypothetical protein
VKLTALLLLLPILAFSQDHYWQQELHYQIDVKLNDKAKSLSGHLSLEYINHSPDTLNYLWFHAWPNGYKDNTTAYAKQLVALKDRSYKAQQKENGYMDSLSFRVNGSAVIVEAHTDFIDVIKISLASPLLPGNKITITTPFHVKVPAYVSRLGFGGDMFMLSQWYPKPAVYDRKGWHPIPYLDQGEFYSDFGTFKVNITLPSEYVVSATGLLNNKEESDRYKKIGQANYTQVKSNGGRVRWQNYQSNTGGYKTLNYSAENIHDFAWFADKDFIITYDTVQLASGKQVDAFSFFQPNGNKEWKHSLDYVKDAVRMYSSWVGEYAYPVVNAVEGPANGNSGGMEYPMVTLITSPGANNERLDAVITHEVGHNWFYGILGTNEREHAWMDEGINSYYQFRYEAEKYKGNSIFGDAIPPVIKQKPADEFLAIIYNTLNKMPTKDAVETPSEGFQTSEDYGMTVYVKAATWMYLLELTLGKEHLDKAMQDYFNQWKFRHPYPEDLKSTLEKSTGVRLDNVFELLQKKGALN